MVSLIGSPSVALAAPDAGATPAEQAAPTKNSDAEVRLKDPIPVPATGTAPQSGTVQQKTGSSASMPGPGADQPAQASPVADPLFPVIPAAQLISPPAVPPQLPPSYYDSQSKPENIPKIKANESPDKATSPAALGPRLQPTPDASMGGAPTPEPLKANIVKTDLTANAGELSGELPSGRKLDVRVVLLSVRNNTTSSIIVNGEQAIINSGGAPMQALPERTVVSRTNPFLTKKQKWQLAGISFATLGLATVIAGEMMTNKTSPSARFGVYETMRRIEDIRFGDRVILPGEESRGLVFFDGTVDVNNTMSLPVSAYPTNEGRGRISVQVLGTAKLQ